MLAGRHPQSADAPLPRRAYEAAAAAPEALSSPLPDSLVWAAILFNFLLCFVHTNLAPVGLLAVVAADAGILLLALLVPFALNSRSPGRMDVLLVVLFANWLLLSLLRQVADPKLFRDVAIMPVFILLGMASRGPGLHRRLFWLHMIILAVAVWEAISVESFVSVFHIADFFGATRGTSSDDWWIDNGLFLSSVRPEARFLFPDLPLHRLSSVFLEPVSLGNYVIIATIWLAGFWRQIPRTMRIVAVLATLLLLVGSDSRMATVTCVVLLAVRPFRAWIPNIAPLLIPLVVIAAMFLAVALLGLQSGVDNFSGRIAYAVNVFRGFDLEDFAGVSLDQMMAVQDAGFAYLIMSQSVVTALVLWGVLFFRRQSAADSRYIHFAVAAYLAFNLTVSWSLFSIKTAALLWFLLGRAIRDDRDSPDEGAEEEELAAEPAPPPRRVQAPGLVIRST